MSGKSPVRFCEDIDKIALSFAEIKALCADNPLIKEKMDLDIKVTHPGLLKPDHQSQHYRLEDDLLKPYPEQIKSVTERITGIEKDLAMYNENPSFDRKSNRHSRCGVYIKQISLYDNKWHNSHQKRTCGQSFA